MMVIRISSSLLISDNRQFGIEKILQNRRKVIVGIIVSVLLTGGLFGWYVNYTSSNVIPIPPSNPQPVVGNIFTTTTTPVIETTSVSTRTNSADTSKLETTSTSTIATTVTTQSTTDRLQTNWAKEWINYANIAWQYYSPGFGVDTTTGLLYASQYFTRFTDWDLAGYVMAIIAAEEL